MAETAEQVFQRVQSAVESDGRLPSPASVGWDVFAWDAVEQVVRPKPLSAPAPEPARWGEDGQPCRSCDGFAADRLVWEDEHWAITHPGGPSGLPVVLMLHTKRHLDFGELDDDRASQFGRISNRLVRIVEAVPNVGRAHVARWGDGGAHFHVWFFGRTAGLPGVLGSSAAEWDDIIPAGSEQVWRDDLRAIATKLAAWGGTPRV